MTTERRVFPRVEPLSPEAKNKIKENLPQLLDNFELAERLLDVSPLTLTEGVDSRLFYELSHEDQLYIEKILDQELGVVENKDFVLRYIRSAPSGAAWTGEAPVDIFRTGRANEGMFIHMTKFPDGKINIAIAPEDHRL